MPIQNGKYINPGWVDNAPPAIDAAELNAISDTLENLDAGGSGGEGKRYARMVIGTSTAGWTAEDCDYLCDGVDDQETFLEAINALPADGGEIKILDGEYTFSNDFYFPQKQTNFYVMFSGCGKTTSLNFANHFLYIMQYPLISQFTILFDNISLLNSTITATAQGRMFLRNTSLVNLYINVSNMQLLVYDCDVYFENSSIGQCFSASSNNPPSAFCNNRFSVNLGRNSFFISQYTNVSAFSGNYVIYENGAEFDEISLSGSISGNCFIGMSVVNTDGSVCGNLFLDCNLTTVGGCATGNVISNGFIAGCNGCSICGNKILPSEAAEAGIRLYKSALEQHKPFMPNTVSGNTIIGGTRGISLAAAPSNMADPKAGNTLVSGNSCDSSIPLQIAQDWSNCLISGNMFPNGAIVDNGTGNTKANNVTGT